MLISLVSINHGSRNYGANFGGPTKATWTSGADSLSAGVGGTADYYGSGVGMFGKYAVGDTSYHFANGGLASVGDGDPMITMCQGNASNDACR